MRKIAATYIFPINQPPLKNGILICEDDGTIHELIDTGGKLPESSGLEYYSGILVPGFINTHCHLELSHLHKKIPEKKGLGDFIGHVNQLRNTVQFKMKQKAMKTADRKMWAGGIAAVGDISNSAISKEIKRDSRIYYHTFVEAFGFHPDRAERAFSLAQITHDEFHENNLSASIVPHAAYSVSGPLFKKISDDAQKNQSILSFHNQESEAEKLFFEQGSGPIANHLQNNLKIDITHWKPTDKNPLEWALTFLPASNKLLLVHNCFTRAADLKSIRQCRNLRDTYFVFCPNSNLYIENRLPQLYLFRNQGLTICIGTDSLASNSSLSVLEELKTLQASFDNIALDEMLKWATINGAMALGIEKHLGTFEKGKNPGVNLISGIDFRNMKLTENSKVKKIV